MEGVEPLPFNLGLLGDTNSGLSAGPVICKTVAHGPGIPASDACSLPSFQQLLSL